MILASCSSKCSAAMDSDWNWMCGVDIESASIFIWHGSKTKKKCICVRKSPFWSNEIWLLTIIAHLSETFYDAEKKTWVNIALKVSYKFLSLSVWKHMQQFGTPIHLYSDISTYSTLYAIVWYIILSTVREHWSLMQHFFSSDAVKRSLWNW